MIRSATQSTISIVAQLGDRLERGEATCHNCRFFSALRFPSRTPTESHLRPLSAYRSHGDFDFSRITTSLRNTDSVLLVVFTERRVTEDLGALFLNIAEISGLFTARCLPKNGTQRGSGATQSQVPLITVFSLFADHSDSGPGSLSECRCLSRSATFDGNL